MRGRFGDLARGIVPLASPLSGFQPEQRFTLLDCVEGVTRPSVRKSQIMMDLGGDVWGDCWVRPRRSMRLNASMVRITIRKLQASITEKWMRGFELGNVRGDQTALG